MISNLIKKAISLWDEFWFAPQNLLGVAFMRIMLCGILFFTYVVRQVHIEYYSDTSWIPRSMVLSLFPDGFRPAFSLFFWPDTWALAMHTLLVVLLGLLTLGIGGRWIAWAAWFLDLAFIQRNYAVNFGADIIGCILLFYLAFTQSCERLSVLNWRKKKTQFQRSDMVSSFFIRMIQIQMGVVYAYTGFEKLKGGSWWEGTALWSVLANPQMVSYDFTAVRYVPWMIAIVSFLTILFETYFPVMVAWKKTRYAWLLMGVSMHLGIAFMMGLWPFSLAMMSTYFLFIEYKDLEKVGIRISDSN
jgi:Vitamin K-dependent gamma-carboxylase.